MINNFRGKFFFLSNFYSADVKYDGLLYKNNEAAFQAQKTLDLRERKTFAYMSPSEAKKAGRHVKLRPDWETVKYDYMLDICRAKFAQNPALAEQLIATGDEELIEGNDWGDKTWGMVNGEGQNLLGKILMQVRDELRKD
ncbi:NADAR family protein [bacterium]|nr:NADAR family protein [bacterium]